MKGYECKFKLSKLSSCANNLFVYKVPRNRSSLSNIHKKMENKNNKPVDEQECEEQLKIKTVINNLQVKVHLDKDQLHDAFISAGLEEVNDVVSEGTDNANNSILSVAAD